MTWAQSPKAAHAGRSLWREPQQYSQEKALLGSEAQRKRRSVLKIHRRQKVRKKREDKKAGNLWGARSTALGWRGETDNTKEALVPTPALGRKRMRGARAELFKIAESPGES